MLSAILAEPAATVEGLSIAIDVSPRTARRLISDLESAGFLTRVREGNRNRYRIHEGAIAAQLLTAAPLVDLVERMR